VTTFHQVLVGAEPSDAIINIAIQSQAELRRLGPSEIFARVIEPAHASHVSALQNLPLGRPTDALIYHSSVVDAEVTSALLRRPEQLVLVYHNASGTEFFVDNDPAASDGFERRRQELAILRDRVVLAVADSKLNADDLIQLGYDEVHLAATGVRRRRLADLPTDPETQISLDEVVGAPFVLSVSELIPHNCQHVLVQAVHVLQTVHRAELGLVMIGSSPDAPYARALHRLVRGLRLRHTWITGPQSNSSLATIYRRAKLYSSASRYENLGIAEIEAMEFGIPTIVRDTGARTQTIARGTLVLPSESGPLIFAEALLMAHEDDRLRSSLVDSGLALVSKFSADGTQSLADVIEATGLAS